MEKLCSFYYIHHLLFLFICAEEDKYIGSSFSISISVVSLSATGTDSESFSSVYDGWVLLCNPSHVPPNLALWHKKAALPFIVDVITSFIVTCIYRSKNQFSLQFTCEHDLTNWFWKNAKIIEKQQNLFCSLQFHLANSKLGHHSHHLVCLSDWS